MPPSPQSQCWRGFPADQHFTVHAAEGIHSALAAACLPTPERTSREHIPPLALRDTRFPSEDDVARALKNRAKTIKKHLHTRENHTTISGA
jgi:hypothetical protein